MQRRGTRGVAQRVVIVGAGHAGGECALRLRRLGCRGEIVLLGEESAPPYQRPPLSKKYLCDEWDLDRLLLRPRHAYVDEQIELVTSVQVASVDRQRRQVGARSGLSWRYDWLVLATGAKARLADLPGSSLRGVSVFRTIDDVDALKASLKVGARLVIVGAGYIGLELAAVARTLGLNVLVCETQDRPLSRTSGPAVAKRLLDLHQQRGVEFRFCEKVAGVVGDKRVEGVLFKDGSEVEADLVVFGIGSVPETDLARDCGLAVDDGVVTDVNCRTSDARIFAIGDCARRPLARGGPLIRLESVHNAIEGARLAAGQIAGADAEEGEAPGFGRISSTQNCRWWGWLANMIRWWSAAKATRSRYSISDRG
ncbi:MAG: NAD(P)/FAD-dependent oxidoreductase [Hyphomonadaceae bacterium JAD_PAG50586_4]|nr:MAG: NAD(P)/FAD-dependent oxidoreductase [Hyphomonadaceae bacterium JAD_PAG50586_4]